MPEPDTWDDWEECYYIMYLDIRRGSPSSPQSAQRLSSKTTLRWGDDSPFKSSITSNASLKSPRTSSSVFTFNCSRALGSFSHSICIMPKEYYQQDELLHRTAVIRLSGVAMSLFVFSIGGSKQNVKSFWTPVSETVFYALFTLFSLCGSSF